MTVSAFHVQNAAVDALARGNLVLASDPVYAVLLSGSYVPAEAHVSYSNVSAFEVTALDYQRKQLTGASVTTTGKTARWSTDDIDFGTTVTISAKYVALFKGLANSPQPGDVFIGWQDLSAVRGDITSVTIGNPGAVTSPAHGLLDADLIVIHNSDMDLIDRTYHTVSNAFSNTFTIGDTSSAKNVATRGSWVKLNDTTEASSTAANFLVQAPVEGWIQFG